MDEIIVELPLGDELQANVKKVEKYMILGMEKVIKHVTIKVEPTLMTRWYKEAEPVYDEEDNLLLWTPKMKEM